MIDIKVKDAIEVKVRGIVGPRIKSLSGLISNTSGNVRTRERISLFL